MNVGFRLVSDRGGTDLRSRSMADAGMLLLPVIATVPAAGAAVLAVLERERGGVLGLDGPAMDEPPSWIGGDSEGGNDGVA